MAVCMDWHWSQSVFLNGIFLIHRSFHVQRPSFKFLNMQCSPKKHADYTDNAHFTGFAVKTVTTLVTSFKVKSLQLFFFSVKRKENAIR